jgi:hypothetical protein
MELLDVVALIKDLPEQKLYKGHVGTIVEVYESDVFEVKFVDFQGKTYAVETINSSQVMQLYYQPIPQTV